MVETTGLQDFARLLGDRRSFALLAVKVKAGAVAAALADTYPVHEIIEEAAADSTDEPTDAERWSSVVQLRDDAWSFVVWRVGPQTLESQGALAYSAQDLTTTFDTDAVAVVSEAPVLWDCDLETDQQKLCSLRLYRNGELVEELVAESGGRVLSFESEEGSPPAAQEDALHLIDQWLTGHDLGIPACLPEAHDGGPRLRLLNLDPASFERRILLTADLNLPLEDETLDMLIDQRPTRKVRVRGEDGTELEEPADDGETELGAFGRFGRWVGNVLGR